MKKSYTLIISALIVSVLAITTLLVIFGIKGELYAFFTSKWGFTIGIFVGIYLILLIAIIIKERINKL